MDYGHVGGYLHAVHPKQKAGYHGPMMAEKLDDQISVWSKRVALVLLGWVASSAYNGTLTLNQKAVKLEHVESVDIPKLKAKAGCEHWRGQVIEKTAKQAIASANSDAVPVPSAKAIPPDNCAGK